MLFRSLYCTVLYCTVLYCTVLYCTVLYCTVTVLYCTVLYSIVERKVSKKSCVSYIIGSIHPAENDTANLVLIL